MIRARGVLRELELFVLTHSRCGQLVGDADLPDGERGYSVWVKCSCGASFERWVTPDIAETDLLRVGDVVPPDL